MNLDLFKNLEKNIKKIEIEDLMNDLSNYLEKNKNREENCLYQVVDINKNSVFLQNTKTNVVFEEKEISQDIKNKIGNDYILRYKDGRYIIDEEITKKYFDNMISISEYRKLKDEFIKNTNISEIDLNTRFNIISREENYTILGYGKDSEIRVNNKLLPYFIDDKTILYYKNGKFYKEI